MRAAILLLSAALIAGCSHQPPISQPIDWSQHQAQLAALDQWQLRGKLGFKSPQRGGSANLQWSQNQQQYQLRLSGPMGTGNILIQGDQTRAQMQQGDQSYVDRPELLAARFTGLPIPVDALSWWVRGLPSPSKSAAMDLIISPDGTASSFVQEGWQLSFSGYRMTKDGHLPRKISGQLGAQSFKLVISNWNPPAK